MIPIYKPYIAKYKISAIDAIDTEWISNHGKYINLASEKLKYIVGSKYCILMNNGTSATHCIFKALKFKYPTIKKIYVPNNVFVAPWNCALMEYPELMIEVMKINKNTLNIDTSEEYINSLDYNSAICIVHNLGNIVNIPKLKKIRPDIIFIEDNCEGLFGKYENKYSGTASLCSAVSFYGNKTITTGEGGAFFTDDVDIYNYINSIYSHGMTNKRYIHCHIATNFRMTNIQAAFLYDQLNDIEHILYLKNRIFDTYTTHLKQLIDSNKIKLLDQEINTVHSKWMYSIIVMSKKYEDIEEFMKLHNIEVRPIFYDIHEHSHLTNISKHDTTVTKYCGILLPSFPELTYEEQLHIVNTLNNYLDNTV